MAEDKELETNKESEEEQEDAEEQPREEVEEPDESELEEEIEQDPRFAQTPNSFSEHQFGAGFRPEAMEQDTPIQEPPRFLEQVTETSPSISEERNDFGYGGRQEEYIHQVKEEAKAYETSGPSTMPVFGREAIEGIRGGDSLTPDMGGISRRRQDNITDNPFIDDFEKQQQQYWSSVEEKGEVSFRRGLNKRVI